MAGLELYKRLTLIAHEGQIEKVFYPVFPPDKNAEEVHYATGTLEQQVFVSRYLTRLPTEDQLRAWLAEERELLARRRPAQEGSP